MWKKISEALGLTRPPAPSFAGEAYAIPAPYIDIDAPTVGDDLQPAAARLFVDADERSYLGLPNPAPTESALMPGREGVNTTSPPPMADRRLSPDFGPLFGLYMHTLGDYEIQDTDHVPMLPQIALLPGAPYEPPTAEDNADLTEIIYVP